MKKEIVERLLKAGHINFDEALELMDKQETTPIVVRDWQPMPYVAPQYPTCPNPNAPWWAQPQITC